MSAFPLVQLGEVATVRSGYAFKSKDWTDSGVSVIKIQNVRAGRVDPAGCSFVSTETAAGAARYRLRDGDILVTMSGEIGSVGLVRNSAGWMLNQRVGKVELTSGHCDPAFIYYALLRPDTKKVMEATAYGAAQPNISPKLIAALEIPMPDHRVQIAVASTLSAYDELIENNTRRIKILEEMAQSIYKEWFVDFRYPGHENVPLVDSELGPIPEGWRCVRVDEMGVIQRGRSYKGSDVVPSGGLPFLNLKCIDRDGGFRRSGIKRYVGPYKSSHVADAGDVLVAVTDMTQERRIVARAGRVPASVGSPAIVSMDLVRLSPTSACGPVLLYSVLRFSGFAESVKNFANGANVLHLHPDRIAEFKVAVPSDELSAHYESAVGRLLDLAEALEVKCSVLRETRDLLLPRLVSGEIDVSHSDVPDE